MSTRSGPGRRAFGERPYPDSGILPAADAQNAQEFGNPTGIVTRRAFLGGATIATLIKAEAVRAAIGGHAQAASALVSVEDCVEGRRAVTFAPSNEPLFVSPSGRFYVLLLVSGDIARDRNKLEIFAGDLEKPEIAPRLIASMTTRDIQDNSVGILPPTHPGNNRVVWSKHENEIFMLWNDGTKPTQLIAVNHLTGAISKLTDHPTSVTSFGVDGNGEALLYTAYPRVQRPADEDRRIIINFADGVYGVKERFALEERPWDSLELHSARRGRQGAREIVRGGLDRGQIWPSIFSPDGKFAVLPDHLVAPVPAHWLAYKTPALRTRFARTGVDPGGGWTQQIAIIDLEAGRYRPLWDAPNPSLVAPQILITPDSAFVIAGPVLPPPGQPERLILAAISARTGEHHVIVEVEGKTIHSLRWTGSDLEVAFDGHSERFRQTAGGWSAVGSILRNRPAAEAPSLGVELKGSMNSPPVLRAKSQPNMVLLDVEPRWRQRRLGLAEPFSWQDATGRKWKGRLYRPVYPSSRRLPLVIQTHGCPPEDVFAPLGHLDSRGNAYAAQPLASKQVYVLQVPDIRDRATLLPFEPDSYAKGYEGAIAELDRGGFIDRTRVGIMGYSRTGWHVLSTLALTDFPYAAANVSDCITASYFEAILRGNPSRAKAEVGADSYGANFATWLERSAAFNADRIRTPLRVEVPSLGPSAALQHWELFARMKDQRLPIELDVAANSRFGSHPLQNPRMRLASQQASVDWFDFWLNDLEDQPASDAQTERWKTLRSLRDAAATRPRPPLLKWTATPVNPQGNRVQQ